ncbi:sarcosine oxidase subunit beta [Candidatus Termititenax persephonae]|uniref:Sarcosine oxidase subunit beta n=1 Tax=Candidatus Termititenax persephonae TaxID=2218525 RepID=A0A388TF61_9BACT|nr:sarcosine oxidase subunit beta [Candidatus Termititenax persephonae]
MVNKTADVLIIGGGIVGCAAAYYLVKGGCSVIVLEKEETIGSGGSSRNGGGVRQSGRDPRELPLAMHGIKNIWPTLSAELDCDVEYCQKGNLRLGQTEAQLRILESLTQKAVACGLEVRMISGDEARQINPYLSEAVLGASWCPTDGHANPLAATLAFYRQARRLGAVFISGEAAQEIRQSKGQARTVTAAHGVYEGGTIIVAAGLGSRPLLNTVGLDVPLQPALLETLVTEAVAEMFPQMLGTAAADFYGHQSARHGSFIFGITSGYEFCARPGFPRSSAAAASAACRSILAYFPSLADVKIIRSWAGWMDDCADHVPVISFAAEVPGLLMACGFSGHGFGISPAVGELLSEMVIAGRPSLDLTELRHDRFVMK